MTISESAVSLRSLFNNSLHRMDRILGRLAWPLSWLVKSAIAASISFLLSLSLASSWKIFPLLWCIGFICVYLSFAVPPIATLVSWLEDRQLVARQPISPSMDGELIAKLRAEWLKPTDAERGLALCFLVLPLTLSVAGYIFGFPQDLMVVSSFAHASPAFGGSIIAAYRRRRRKRQKYLNARALDLTRSGSEFVLYLRSFNTSNRLLVRNTMSRALDRMLVGFHWDIEYALSNAFETSMPLVAIGSKGRGIGAAKITTDDEHWQQLFQELAKTAKAILIVPSLTSGTQREVLAIAAADELLGKTIWIMPPTYWGARAVLNRLFIRSHKRNWEAVRSALSDILPVPSYHRSGALIYAGADRMNCKRYRADDLAEDRLQPLLATVLAAAAVERHERENALSSFNPAERSKKYRLQEWLFRRWIGSPALYFGFLPIVTGLLAFISLILMIAVFSVFGLTLSGSITSGQIFPTLLLGDKILFKIGEEPHRGDISLIQFASAQTGKTGEMGISRIIGMPGEHVKIEHGTVFINGEAVAQQPANDALEGDLSVLRQLPGGCMAEIDLPLQISSTRS